MVERCSAYPVKEDYPITIALVDTEEGPPNPTKLVSDYLMPTCHHVTETVLFGITVMSHTYQTCK